MSEAKDRLLLDTNLLLFFLVAQTDAKLLQRFKRVSMFDMDDVRALTQLLTGRKLIISTPHILAEVSNFVQQVPFLRAELTAQLTAFILDNVESYQPASDLVHSSFFEELGLTDAAVADVAKTVVVATLDRKLAARVTAAGGAAINFHDYRLTYLQDHA